jgi:hypothetical protein
MLDPSYLLLANAVLALHAGVVLFIVGGLGLAQNTCPIRACRNISSDS